jgi:large subunit ribosomal protein L15
MQIHNLKREHKNKKDRIVGRGGKHAKTSGRGTKGQSSRAGNKKRPALRDAIKKIPKLRGYRFNSRHTKLYLVSLDAILNAKPEKEINPTTLVELGLVKKTGGRIPKVKILSGNSDFTLKLDFSGVAFSASAKEDITKAGGTIKE